MSGDQQIRFECLNFERHGAMISDEVALGIAERWPGIRGIGLIRSGAAPSMELYGSIKIEADRRTGSFVEEAEELRELRALEAWIRKREITS